MVDVEIEAHADRVGGDDVVDLARLVELDLPVARLRAERAHHHRRAAAEPAQRLGQRVDLLGRETDHRAARRKAGELGAARMGQRGETRAGDDLRCRHQRAHERLERRGAENHRLLAPARVQQPVGKHMPALAIGAQLRLVDADEGDVATTPDDAVAHRLHRAQEVARRGRLDPLLPGDQRDRRLALDRAHSVVHLARQQPQREADRAARMAAHPLDREMRLAGIGRPQNRLDRRFAHCPKVAAAVGAGKGGASRRGEATIRRDHARAGTGLTPS